MALHEPTDDERYLAGPRPAPVLLTVLGWTLGALVAALLLTQETPIQARALELYTGTFGMPRGGGVPELRIAGVVVFGIAAVIVGLFASFLTDIIDGVPKVRLRLGNLGLLLLWILTVVPFALVGFPFLVPIAAGVVGWVRSKGFSPISRRTQTGVWVVFAGIGVAVLGLLMVLRPDLATVIRFA
ncbi:hypothetical protein F1188_01510 [Roseospira marina]|uniref:Tripartite tricarboxylate transporter TctB family protein n=1 Tax=Roseospira marina TaxID=140057 RepID=A0A5M6II11_9PROT|nr:hypothetical protein [Roseospira marina]KAA5607469.1 hypothetical protein F1188_01510 [Roseospira marina]MBB4312351.1 hypothetical protein [Roseospira marina]MBB5085633.1 hypothetical protein [Roseospira marina]